MSDNVFCHKARHKIPKTNLFHACLHKHLLRKEKNYSEIFNGFSSNCFVAGKILHILYIEKDCVGKWMSKYLKANDIGQCTEQKYSDQ